MTIVMAVSRKRFFHSRADGAVVPVHAGLWPYRGRARDGCWESLSPWNMQYMITQRCDQWEEMRRSDRGTVRWDVDLAA
jgi:hypothetical protein